VPEDEAGGAGSEAGRASAGVGGEGEVLDAGVGTGGAEVVDTIASEEADTGVSVGFDPGGSAVVVGDTWSAVGSGRGVTADTDAGVVLHEDPRDVPVATFTGALTGVLFPSCARQRGVDETEVALTGGHDLETANLTAGSATESVDESTVDSDAVLSVDDARSSLRSELSPE